MFKFRGVNTTKFLGVQIDSKLTWKMHIEYTCKKLSKCVGILCKARKKLYNLSHQLILFFCIPLFHILQPCTGNKLPLVPWKDISNTKETYSNYNLLYISSSHRAFIFCKQNPQCLWCQWLYHWVFHVWMPVWNHSWNIQKLFSKKCWCTWS